MKLSIITINFNNLDGLRKTVESVVGQSCHDFEYIIIDGASTDGGAEYLKEIGGKSYSFELKWVSEKDSGIYNAMNKGIEIAEGRRVVNSFNRSELVEDKNKDFEDGYVLMLNSGDYFVDEHVIERIMPMLDGTDIIQGNIIKIKDGKEEVCRGYGKSDISFIDAMGGRFLHQASFCRRELFDTYGYFDESYKINGDTIFFAKCLAFGNASFKYIDLNVAYYDMSGISADPEGKWVVLRNEEDERYAQMFSQRMRDLIYKEEKKIKLYDKLHAHKWSWNVTMLIAKMLK